MLLIYNYNDDRYHYFFLFFNLSDNVTASFLQTTRKTVCNFVILAHLSVLICCFRVSNSVKVSVHGVVFFSISKCFSPQKSFTSCPVSVSPSIIIR